jgi:Uma2 family endonuclease
MTGKVVSEPLLENGDVMDAAEFRRRYEACEDLERVELLEGVVYMPSPTKIRGHGRPQAIVLGWLTAYERLRAGQVAASGPGTLWLDERNAPEPDALLYRVDDEAYTSDGYLAKVPELIVEIANSSRSRDLHQKKAAYEKNGVLEYIVWRVDDRAVDWFQLRNGRYELRQPDSAGIIESEAFPGLRLHVEKLLAHDSAGLLAALR